MAALRVNIVSFLYLDISCTGGTLRRLQQGCLRWRKLRRFCGILRNAT
jgi:hypothetical protein